MTFCTSGVKFGVEELTFGFEYGNDLISLILKVVVVSLPLVYDKNMIV